MAEAVEITRRPCMAQLTESPRRATPRPLTITFELPVMITPPCDIASPILATLAAKFHLLPGRGQYRHRPIHTQYDRGRSSSTLRSSQRHITFGRHVDGLTVVGSNIDIPVFAHGLFGVVLIHKVETTVLEELEVGTGVHVLEYGLSFFETVIGNWMYVIVCDTDYGTWSCAPLCHYDIALLAFLGSPLRAKSYRTKRYPRRLSLLSNDSRGRVDDRELRQQGTSCMSGWVIINDIPKYNSTYVTICVVPYLRQQVYNLVSGVHSVELVLGGGERESHYRRKSLYRNTWSRRLSNNTSSVQGLHSSCQMPGIPLRPPTIMNGDPMAHRIGEHRPLSEGIQRNGPCRYISRWWRLRLGRYVLDIRLRNKSHLQWLQGLQRGIAIHYTVQAELPLGYLLSNLLGLGLALLRLQPMNIKDIRRLVLQHLSDLQPRTPCSGAFVHSLFDCFLGLILQRLTKHNCLAHYSLRSLGMIRHHNDLERTVAARTPLTPELFDQSIIQCSGIASVQELPRCTIDIHWLERQLGWKARHYHNSPATQAGHQHQQAPLGNRGSSPNSQVVLAQVANLLLTLDDADIGLHTSISSKQCGDLRRCLIGILAVLQHHPCLSQPTGEVPTR